MSSIYDDTTNLNESDIASLIDELPLWSAPFGMELLNNIAYQKNMTVLDIGCGNGFPFLVLAQRLGESCKIYGLEPWEASFRIAAEKIRKMELKNAFVLPDTVEKMTFQDNFFDMIVSNNGLNNVKNMEEAFRSCSRVAKNGCRFVYTMNLPDTMKEFYSCFKDSVSEILDNDYIVKIDEHIHTKRKSLEYLKDITEKNGFNVINVIKNEFKMNYLDGTAFLNDFVISMAFMVPWKEIIPDEYHDEVFYDIQNRLNKRAEDKGCLSLSIPYVCIVAEKA